MPRILGSPGPKNGIRSLLLYMIKSWTFFHLFFHKGLELRDHKTFLENVEPYFSLQSDGRHEQSLTRVLIINVAKAQPFKTENTPGIFYHWFDNKFRKLMKLKTIKKWRLSAGTLNWLGPLRQKMSIEPPRQTTGFHNYIEKVMSVIIEF